MIAERLAAAIGAAAVSTEPSALAEARRDQWARGTLEELAGGGGPGPACVARPASVSDVVAVVNACRETGTALVPRGLGSGVCGGVQAPPGSVVLDLSGMDRIRGVDPETLLASFDAGVRGSTAEATLAARGLTLGHYPQSIELSSVGGWVATRAAGQFSTAYGNVEDLLFAVEAVLPSGELVVTPGTPRSSAGPDLRQLLLGSEGTLGVVTGVTFAVRRAPAHRALFAFHLPSMDDGFALQRELLQSGIVPAVLRQYDGIESRRMFSAHARGEDPLLLGVVEGEPGIVGATVAALERVAAHKGAAPADPAAAASWLAARNHVPKLRSFLESGLVVDTIEVAAPWDRIGRIYRDGVAALALAEGALAGSAHSSHAYRAGLNLYFTFALRPVPERRVATYDDAWARVLEATLAAGGGISHHHGIGRVRRGYLARELGDGGLAALRAVKRALDPTGFMNPGVLLPDG